MSAFNKHFTCTGENSYVTVSEHINELPINVDAGITVLFMDTGDTYVSDGEGDWHLNNNFDRKFYN